MIVNLVLLVSSVSRDRTLPSVQEVIIVPNTQIIQWNFLAQRVPTTEEQTSQMNKIVCHAESATIALKDHGRPLSVHRALTTTSLTQPANAEFALQVSNVCKEPKSQFHVLKVDTLTKDSGAALIVQLVNSAQSLRPLDNSCWLKEHAMLDFFV
jgi:hypothetical protein